MHAKPDLRVFLKWMIARSGSVITDVISLKPVPGDRMIQLVRRFILGFCIGAAFSLVLFFVARTFFYSTIQTPESEPHFEVLYAGFRSELALALVGLGPLLSGLASVALVKRTVNGLAFFTSTLASLLMSYGLYRAFFTIVFDTVWGGMD